MIKNMETLERVRQYTDWFVILAGLSVFAFMGFHSLVAQSAKMEQNYESKDLPVGMVVGQPEDLGNGIYFVKIEINNRKKPNRYLAITASPDDFPIGSQAFGRSIITTNTDRGLRDMFYIAVKPPKTALSPKLPDILWNPTNSAMPAYSRERKSLENSLRTSLAEKNEGGKGRKPWEQ